MSRTRPGPCVRRIPDDEGNLVTYLALCELERLLGVTNSTISKWVQAGAVRSPGVLHGHRHASVLDATRLVTLPAKATFAMGIRRTPEDELRKHKEVFAGHQQRTIPIAEDAGQEWDSYDIAYVVERFQQGMRVEDIAKNMERTYSAVLNLIQRLRRDGDLPERPAKQRFLIAALALLTPDEHAALEQDLEAVAA